ncbi:hypothetical protein CO131_00025 [Candidatus Kaiserbacteria bacterium CG_4_9_14_3_um_filter_50_16]|uniref:Uncharacterized protein n=2 Tax=Candidatus Kaiseribacteriota TaxID=1752734 RepID=A0A2M7FDM8_9BACT|nr:MAG: hypothetical protein AUJ45_02490 [Parcubacteria group bacterium CG1_02_50_68]PIS43262.1 MAG: hypothetical protein COT23_02225 [Candidatus Kaiserbacteria bacterium CG08_land_8_20_14_0_20_50_21]PIU82039.1 MAG: hypothetical protein COS69_01245 [Candidatus Kaiserbacteria bacterium CG06_land_8_20_14_3_00_49_31]PIV87217.1 MAG: hypothetical protein COW49_00780 [Candidatus Kaiserbacteria bacterium CG17_big_fil_post_rev_8_21_14_2_50_51_7]PIW96555.1 MAG: hypothetical protein COZ83_00205 [Candidat
MKSSFFHLVFAIVVCVVILIGYGVWHAAIAKEGAAVTTLQSQIDAKTEAINRMSTTQTVLADITGDEAVVQSYFVSETGVVAFINDLEDRGRLLGTVVNVLSVSTGVVPAQPTLVFALTINGTFDAVMRTVGAIEYAPYDISISTLSVGQDGKNNWHADLKLSVGSSVASTTAKTL